MPQSDLSRTLFALFFLISCAYGQPASLQARVVAPDGQPVAEATVMTSDHGYRGWAETDTMGMFDLKLVGDFVTIRDDRFKPKTLRTKEVMPGMDIVLQRRDNQDWTIPNCRDLPKIKRIGHYLQIPKPRRGTKGPVYGDHDSHWYVEYKNNSLHLVDGYLSHSGLPSGVFSSTTSLAERGWQAGNQFGVDYKGRTVDGKRWRWIAPLFAEAIEYRDATEEEARYFDQLISRTCYQVR